MRVPYTVTNETHAQYRHALNNDLGIYHIQTGAGIGGFLKNMFTKYVVPIGKSFLKQSYEIAKPELQKMGKDLSSAAVDYGTRQVKTVMKRGRNEVDKVTRKMRKVDVLD